MKLTPQITTDIRPKGQIWEYSKLQIDTTQIKKLRVAVYDNSPNTNHVFEKKRYRCELQLWNADTKQADYKLFNHFSNYKTFKNNKWKPTNDPYKNWYDECVDHAKLLNEEYGSQAVIGHACLGVSKTHAGRDDGSYGFYNQPKYAAHMMINSQVCIVNLQIEDYKFDLELPNTMEIEKGDGALQYWGIYDVG